MKTSILGKVAVTGIAFRLPGGLNDQEKLWNFLCSAQDTVTDVPSDRWSVKRFYHSDSKIPGKTYMKRGSFLRESIQEFEPLFFGISPREAASMDPQQRLLLEVAWEAIEDGGLNLKSLHGSRTGVFVGSFSLDALATSASPLNREIIRDHFAATATSVTMLSARISHVFGLCGPSLSIDTACSSSLVSIHQACVSLITGESNIAIAGGVNVMFNPQIPIVMSKGHFLAPDGVSKSFDAEADGYGRGEGCILFILKRLEDAESEGDRIHAIIDATGVNQDGHTPAITMPNSKAQEELLSEVMLRAGIEPEQIAYVEAHGTGTSLGDPLETEAIGRAVGMLREPSNPVIIGSIKSSIGHLEAAAGAAGFLKAILCLKNNKIPPQANLNIVNPSIMSSEWNINFQIGEVLPISATDKNKKAIVNSFGYGGTNSVALLSSPTSVDHEPPVRYEQEIYGFSGYTPFFISSFSEKSLFQISEQYIDFLENNSSCSIDNISYSLLNFKNRLRNRSVIIFEDKVDLITKLKIFNKGDAHKDIITGVCGEKNKICFVFSGMGSQWWGMGRYLLQHAPTPVKELSEKFNDMFFKKTGMSIINEILSSEENSNINKTIIAQPSIFLIQICISKFLSCFGVLADGVIGHSVGEVAAAYTSGLLTLEDAIDVIHTRSVLQARLDGHGGMLAVAESAEKVSNWIIENSLKLDIAAVNSPISCTVSGSLEDIELLHKYARSMHCSSIRLNVNVPYHNFFMDNFKDEMHERLQKISPKNSYIPFYSTVYGRKNDNDLSLDSSYWFDNARKTVKFKDALENAARDDYTLFLEIGPSPVLSSSMHEILQKDQISAGVIPSLNRRVPEKDALARLLARLAVEGIELDWSRVVSGKRVDLPSYPWNREYVWLETDAAADDRLGRIVHPLLGLVAPYPGYSWVSEINDNYLPWLSDHCIDGLSVFPASAYVEAAIAAHYQIEKKFPLAISNISINAPLILGDDRRAVVRWVFDDKSRVFSCYSGNSSWDKKWSFHSQATLYKNHPSLKANIPIDDILKDTIEVENVSFFYENLHLEGLNYGPSFQTVKILRQGSGCSSGFVSIKNYHEDESYFVHPALLDGAMHIMIAALPKNFQREGSVFLPSEIEFVEYSGVISDEMWIRSEIKEITEQSIYSDLLICDEGGQVILRIMGLKCQKIPRKINKDIQEVEEFLYRPVYLETERQVLFAESSHVAMIGRHEQVSDKLSSVLHLNGVVSCFWSIDEMRDNIYSNNADYLKCMIYFVPLGLSPEDTIVSCLDFMKCFSNVKEISYLPRLVIVTNQAIFVDNIDQDINISHSGVLGFFRGVSCERSDLKIKIIDISNDYFDDDIIDLASDILLNDQEENVAVRNGKRFVSRLISTDFTPKIRRVNVDIQKNIENQEWAINLKKNISGALDRMQYVVTPLQDPSPDEVIFKILSAGLNFKDVLKAMNLLPESVTKNTYNGKHLGMEASAEVLSVGEKVKNFRIGEKYIIAAPGCLSSHIVLSEKNIISIPLGEMNPVDGATVAVAFATSYFALHNLAHVKSGEKVLIHSASGAVGLAAVQIALAAGAIVYATAGNEEKREYLKSVGCSDVYSSRNIEFYEKIKGVTNGCGVDIVLNSLSGEALCQSLKLVAPFGRFVEIGKKDIIEKNHLPLDVFNNNIAFFSFDLDRMIVERPSAIVELMNEMKEMIESKIFSPIVNTVFSADNIIDAFRFLSSAKHIGKVVVSFSDLESITSVLPTRKSKKISSNGSYLITGGFGGVGLKTAEWLARNGATRIFLIGHRNAERPSVNALVNSLSEIGALVTTHILDVADPEAVKNLFDREDFSSLKGVFHCAGLIEDGLIEKLDDVGVRKVMLPKVEGARNIVNITEKYDLDYFIMFSSITTQIGNIGQSAYISANSCLDALASSLWNEGRNVLSIGCGPISDIGMLVGHSAALQSFSLAGIHSIKIEKILDLIPSLLEMDYPVIDFVHIDWEKWFNVMPRAAESSHFSAIYNASEKSSLLSETQLILLGMPEEEKPQFAVDRLKILLGKVLQISPSNIDNDTKLLDLGVDSLAGVELQMGIRAEFGVDVSFLALARNESISDMTKNLLKQINRGGEREQSLEGEVK